MPKPSLCGSASGHWIKWRREKKVFYDSICLERRRKVVNKRSVDFNPSCSGSRSSSSQTWTPNFEFHLCTKLQQLPGNNNWYFIDKNQKIIRYLWNLSNLGKVQSKKHWANSHLPFPLCCSTGRLRWWLGGGWRSQCPFLRAPTTTRSSRGRRASWWRTRRSPGWSLFSCALQSKIPVPI